MENESAKKILAKYLQGGCTPEEKSIVENWYLKETESVPSEIEEPDYPGIENTLWADIKAENHRNRPSGKRMYWAAAAAVLVLCTLIYFSASLYHPGRQNESLAKADVPSGGNKALLTLADGTKIVLDHAAKGQIAQQSGSLVTKTRDGILVYSPDEVPGNTNQNPSALNTIETPRGGQYQVNLPDGTRVWINASSSLSYPVRFSGNQRKVILKGEAYFEVAKNKEMPFIVNSTRQSIEVLGTHFNVNAYPDEAVTRTTLAEGSVKVSLTGSLEVQMLKPGQQAIADSRIKVIPIDIEEALAWKDGIFMFNDENLESIMRKVARWYDVEIDFRQDELRKKHFSGTVSRFGQVSQILKTLELTGAVHFKIERRTIIVEK